MGSSSEDLACRINQYGGNKGVWCVRTIRSIEALQQKYNQIINQSNVPSTPPRPVRGASVHQVTPDAGSILTPPQSAQSSAIVTPASSQTSSNESENVHNNPKSVVIYVTFDEKEEAKQLGAWWDPNEPVWMVTESNNAAIERFGELKKVYLNVSFEEKDIVKGAGAKYDFELKMWYSPSTRLNETLKKYCIMGDDRSDIVLTELVGEDREFGGSRLFVDLIPQGCWFKNVRRRYYAAQIYNRMQHPSTSLNDSFYDCCHCYFFCRAFGEVRCHSL